MAAPADLRLRAQCRRRAERLGPFDRRLPPARCARPGGQARAGPARTLRRPCDGGRVHAGQGRRAGLRGGAAARRRGVARPGDAAPHAACRRAARRRVVQRRDGGAASAPGLGRRLRGATLLRRRAGAAAATGGRQAPQAAPAPRRGRMRGQLAPPCRTAARARAPGLPAEPGRAAGRAKGADGGEGSAGSRACDAGRPQTPRRRRRCPRTGTPARDAAPSAP